MEELLCSKPQCYSSDRVGRCGMDHKETESEFIYYKQTGLCKLTIRGITFVLSKKEMEDLQKTIDIGLLEADPNWHEYIKNL